MVDINAAPLGDSAAPSAEDRPIDGQTTRSAAVVCIATALGGSIAAAASDGVTELWGASVPIVAAVIAFAINWLAFVPAFLARTEHYYDLTGSLTYLTVVAVALVGGTRDGRSLLLGAMVVIWALRLGTFLFTRIKRAGGDGRFDSMKHSAVRFFAAWTLQGLWVFVTSCAALAAMTSVSASPLGILDLVGGLIWGVGFAIEIIADHQKAAFRRHNGSGFITSGLWSWSRHPNYFGEIVLWSGVAVMAASALSGWQWVTLTSPVFVALLLTRVSGIPLLERRAEARWGHLTEYQRYTAMTPVLLPRPPAR